MEKRSSEGKINNQESWRRKKHGIEKFQSHTKVTSKVKEKNSDKPDIPLTQRKETEAIMDKANLTPKQREKLHKPLLISNAVCRELKETNDATKPLEKKAIHRVV